MRSLAATIDFHAPRVAPGTPLEPVAEQLGYGPLKDVLSVLPDDVCARRFPAGDKPRTESERRGATRLSYSVAADGTLLGVEEETGYGELAPPPNYEGSCHPPVRSFDQVLTFCAKGSETQAERWKSSYFAGYLRFFTIREHQVAPGASWIKTEQEWRSSSCC